MLKLVKAMLVGLSMTVIGLDSGNVQPTAVSAASTEYYVASDGSDRKIAILHSHVRGHSFESILIRGNKGDLVCACPVIEDRRWSSSQIA